MSDDFDAFSDSASVVAGTNAFVPTTGKKQSAASKKVSAAKARGSVNVPRRHAKKPRRSDRDPLSLSAISDMCRTAGITIAREESKKYLQEMNKRFLRDFASTLDVYSGKRKTIYLQDLHAAARHHGINIYGLEAATRK